jgi:AraC-like DNA-binding protein
MTAKYREVIMAKLLPRARSNMEPSAAYVRLERDAEVPSEWRGLDQFSITRLEGTCGLGSDIRKWSCVPALLVSVPIRPLVSQTYRLWFDEKLVPTRSVRPFQSNVLDFAAGPACWAGDAFDFTHFHLPQSSINELAIDLGYDRPGGFRPSVLGNDAVLAQITKDLVPHLDDSSAPSTLALDELQLLMGGHLLRQYSGVQQPRAAKVGVLATWQRRRAQEVLSESRGGNIRLGELARECELPMGYFARAFKSTFGTTCQQWLIRQRIAHSKKLLSQPLASVTEVAMEAGFRDSRRFVRAFRRVVGVAPGSWHRQHGRALH